MIRLEVESYCHNCPRFHAASSSHQLFSNDEVVGVETIDFCLNVAELIRKEIKND